MKVIHFAHTSTGAPARSSVLASSFGADRRWAYGDLSGRGVRVCVIDSGVDGDHPEIGPLAGSFVAGWSDGACVLESESPVDVGGHGTACAGIIRRMAPACEITSIRVLGANNRGNGDVLLGALTWAVEQEFDLVNLSLSTQRHALKEGMHDLADAAWFRSVTIVAAAHNLPVDSYPWRFSSVLSVGSHHRPDPEWVEANPRPPVDFFGSGVQVPVPWVGGSVRTASGNSFATPHIVGMCARIKAAHPTASTTEIRHILASVADNQVVDQCS